MPEYRFDVYIQFDWDHEEDAMRIAIALRDRGITVSSSSRRITPAKDSLTLSEAEVWSASRLLILLVSRTGSHLPFVAGSFLAREGPTGPKLILPVLLKGSLLPSSLAGRASVTLRDSADADELNRAVESIAHFVRPEASATTKPEAAKTELPMPDELVQSCRDGECVLFAGAGLSARCGVPTWTEFLFALLRHAQTHQLVDDGYAMSLEAALKEGERDSAADGLVQLYSSNRELLQGFLHSYFKKTSTISPAHEVLRQLPFASIITTNYDRLIEEGFPDYAKEVFTPKDPEPLLDALAQKRRFILKLYGQIERLETLIVAPIEYREALASNISFSKFMEGIFFSKSFFFVGLSLEGIQDFLSGFVFRGTSPRKHFALVGIMGSAWKAKAELLRRRYNIEVISFPISDGYPEVDEFLQALHHALRPEAHHSSATPSATDSPGVRRVVLEDIGPFEHLDLSFPKEHTWKVLLGDNGVGKSTILKAIAVAIMGSDARSFAARLVRTGKTRGRITLYTEKNPHSGYVTEILTKDMLSEAEVVSLPSRPMEAEGWLALGFSPLRVVTWAPTTGPQAIIQKGRPTADDLIPLISGEADPRMDRLKQWIVNLDSADKPNRPRTLAGHDHRVSTVVFADDKTLVSGSVDRTIRYWDCERGVPIRKIEGHSGGVNFLTRSGDGKTLLSGSYDRSGRSWDLSSGESLGKFSGSQSQIFCVATNSDASVVFTASESGSIRFWNREGGEVRRISTGRGAVWSLALSPDGEILASGNYDGTISLHHVGSGAEIGNIAVRRGVVMSLAWTPNGKRLLCGSRNGPVTEWDMEALIGLRGPAGKEPSCLREFAGSDTRSVAISADGRIVAAGFEHGEIKAWDYESGKELLSVQAHPQAVWSVAISPNGHTIASASADKTIKLWNLPGATTGGNQQETIRRFFRLFGVLTDRTDIDYIGVTENFRVMVKAGDSPSGVPIELLSQGMTSLFGWIGILCQRMQETLEIPTNDPLPTGSYALVLIDELDAHMHPSWQQVLVHRLKKAFPKVQFIACTHSPLIAGGLAKEEVDRFVLQDGKVAKLEFEPDMTLGRYDQILTGELFGLDSTLDPATQDYMAEYEDLLGEPERNSEQEARFVELGRLLEQRIPPSPSNLLARRASELLEALEAHGGNHFASARIMERMGQLAKVLRGDEA